MSNSRTIETPPAVVAAKELLNAAGIDCVLTYMIDKESLEIGITAGGPSPGRWIPLACSIQIAVEMDPLNIEGICNNCRCTDQHACVDEGGSACHWVNDERTMCSNCEQIIDAWLEYLAISQNPAKASTTQ